MVSAEFKSAVSDNRLLRTRIMLKDSLVIDPTFRKFNEMLDYASERIKLYDPYDGEFLEPDESKWDEEIMNRELGQIVNNFSEMRIVHLKKVIGRILRPKITNRICHTDESQDFMKPIISTKVSKPCGCIKTPDECKKAKIKALTEIGKESRKLTRLIKEVDQRNKWRQSDVDDVERIANKLLESVHNYRENR